MSRSKKQKGGDLAEQSITMGDHTRYIAEWEFSARPDKAPRSVYKVKPPPNPRRLRKAMKRHKEMLSNPSPFDFTAARRNNRSFVTDDSDEFRAKQNRAKARLDAVIASMEPGDDSDAVMDEADLAELAGQALAKTDIQMDGTTEQSLFVSDDEEEDGPRTGLLPIQLPLPEFPQRMNEQSVNAGPGLVGVENALERVSLTLPSKAPAQSMVRPIATPPTFIVKTRKGPMCPSNVRPPRQPGKMGQSTSLSELQIRDLKSAERRKEREAKRAKKALEEKTQEMDTTK